MLTEAEKQAAKSSQFLDTTDHWGSVKKGL